MEEVGRSIWLNLLYVIALIVVNGFFAASEIAIISINKNKVINRVNMGDNKSKLLLNLIDEPSKFLATIQIGVILSGFFASAFGAINFSKSINNTLQNSNLEFIKPLGSEISFALVTIVIALTTLILGQLVPKKIALAHCDRVAYMVIKPIWFISKIGSPLINILTMFANIISTPLENRYYDDSDAVSEEEIKMLIDDSEKNGIIDSKEKDMINGVFRFNDTIAREVMTPRTSVFAIDINDPIEDIINSFLEEKCTRVPVYEDDIDNIIGIIHIKDLIVLMNSKKKDISIRSILIKPFFVPETKNINLLFRDLQQTKNHMAILIDEYGGFTGILTANDLIEEIMGTIHDEHDDDANEIEKLDNKTYILDGLVSINDLNKSLNLQLPSQDYDTVGGFLISLLGKIPKDNEEYTLEFGNLVFKTEKISEKRIEKIKMFIA